jgi:hypothetical protein
MITEDKKTKDFYKLVSAIVKYIEKSDHAAKAIKKERDLTNENSK